MILHFFSSRPNDGFFTFMGPLTMLRYLIWEPYKWVMLKILVVALLLLILGLFLYSMPVSYGYTFVFIQSMVPRRTVVLQENV